MGLINGRCQKCCQSILCLFGFIWTSGEVEGGEGGERATKGEVVTESGRRREEEEGG